MCNKPICILLIIFIIFCGAGCKLKPTQNSTVNKYSSNDNMLRKAVSRGGVLKLFSTHPDSYNPLLSENLFIKEYVSLIYEGMYTIDSEQKAVPVIVDNATVSIDGLNWNFKLKDNIFWHDGIVLSANDLEFSFKTILGSTNQSIYKSNLNGVLLFTAIDNLNFKITLSKPDTFLPWKLIFPILPAHYYSTAQDFQKDTLRFPVGTGPFKYTDFKDNKNIILKSNEKWWGSPISADKKLPYIDEINILMYDSINSIIEAFGSGEVDVIMLNRGMWSNFVGRRDIVLQKYASNEFEFLSFNVSGNSWISDKSVRKAINVCLDRIEIINNALSGEAIPADIPIFPESWLNDGATTFYLSSQQRAKEILESAGWNLQEGLRFKTVNGYKNFLRLNLLVNIDNNTRLNVAEKIKEQLSSIGIGVEIIKHNSNDYFNLLKDKQYEMAIAGIRTSKAPEMESLYFGSTTQTNINGYDNAELNIKILEYMNESDIIKKKTILRNLRLILDENVPIAGLYYYYNAVVYNKKFKGVFEPHYWNKLNNFTEWFLVN